MRAFKKILSLFVSVMMLVQIASISIVAQEDADQNVIDTTVEVSGNEGEQDANDVGEDTTDANISEDDDFDLGQTDEDQNTFEDETVIEDKQDENTSDNSSNTVGEDEPVDDSLVEIPTVDDEMVNEVELLSGGAIVEQQDGSYIIKEELKVSGGTYGIDFRFDESNGILYIDTDTILTLANVDPDEAISDIRIYVPAATKDANLVFNSINLKNSTNSPFTLEPKSEGGAGATIILADGTTNTLTSTAAYYPGIRVGRTTTLRIDDSLRNIDINGDPITPVLGRIPLGIVLSDGTVISESNSRLTLLDSLNPGTLNVVFSNSNRNTAAALGGGTGESGGNIIIDGGNINATNQIKNNGGGAGIGGGYRGDGGNIMINGGNVTAQGAYHGAGIGGGYASAAAEKDPNAILTPAVIDQWYSGGLSGNITVNGGYIISKGGAHGNGFGDGCDDDKVPINREVSYTVRINGGTIVAEGGYDSANPNLADFGGKSSDVIVTGGSFMAKRFNSRNSNNAYSDETKETPVFMTRIILESYEDIKSLSLVEDIKVYYQGVEYDYGAPKCVDKNKVLYFWLPNKESDGNNEARVELEMINTNGDISTYDPFYIPNATNGATLKQYVIFDIPEDAFSRDELTKRYDGLPIGTEIANKLVTLNDGNGILVSNPENSYLNDADFISFMSQRINDPEDIENNFLPSDVGEYNLTVISSQYADTSPFNDTFWGHRATGLIAEIIKADSKTYETKIAVNGTDLSTYKGIIDYSTKLEVSAKVLRADDEADTCKTPTGYVVFYLVDKDGNNIFDEDGTKVEIGRAKLESTDSSQDTAAALATIKFTASSIYEHLEVNGPLNIKACYIGAYDDVKYVNYNESCGETVTVEEIINNNIDTDGDGNPDINIDKEPDGKPDINIDVDGDFIPDLNIDTDKDGKPDVNIDYDNDLHPEINVDTDNTGEWKPSNDGGNSDGIWKPDHSIDVGEGDFVNSDRIPVDNNGDGVDDHWRPNKDKVKDGFTYDTADPDVNIDTDGNGNPDINIDVDGDRIPDINIDTDLDGRPDVNIDFEFDIAKPEEIYPDINIDTDGTGTWKPSGKDGNSDGIWKPDTNIDTDADGVGDKDSTRKPCDNDGDGVDDWWNPDKNGKKDDFEFDTADPDVNIDTDGDGDPDINIDVDGDGKPDINIDTDLDGKPDVNVDIDGGKKPDINIDTDGTGTWKPSGEGGNNDNIWNPDKDIDTDADGVGDKDDLDKTPTDEDKDGVDDDWKPNTDGEKDGTDFDTMCPDCEVVDECPDCGDNNSNWPNRPSRPGDKEESCEERFGDDWHWSDEYGACVLKEYSIVIVDTSTK